MKITEEDCRIIHSVFKGYGIKLPFHTDQERNEFFHIILNLPRPWRTPSSIEELLNPWAEVQGMASKDRWEECQVINGELFHKGIMITSLKNKEYIDLNTFKVR